MKYRIFEQVRYPGREDFADVVSYYPAGYGAEWQALGRNYQQWCSDNCMDGYFVNISDGHIYFSSPDDLTLFLITMGMQPLTEL